MTINRRQFLTTTAALAGASMLPLRAFAANDIKFGSILDTSGPFDAYGKPMDMAMRLAIGEINAAGGLNGEKIEIDAYDTQSNMALYTQYAQQLTRQDKVDVVHGGILSASREAIRQILRKSKTLYFYNVLYEGGVCDRNIFINGVTPAQQVEVLIPYAMKKSGKKVYVLAADYNYGQITAKWIQKYVADNGGET
ncbi:MAG: urea ABC transporter, partial [Alphaproteobacteria bacterium]